MKQKLKKRIEVSGYVVGEGKSKNYIRVQVNKLEKVCGKCGQTIDAAKPFGQVWLPVSIGQVDELIISIKKKGTLPLVAT